MYNKAYASNARMHIIVGMMLLMIALSQTACPNMNASTIIARPMQEHALKLAVSEWNMSQQKLAVSPLHNPFFKVWRFWNISTTSEIPPRSIIVVTDDEKATKLAFADGFKEQVSKEPVQLTTPELAIEYTQFFIATTDPQLEILSYASDIPGISQTSLTEYTNRIHSPRAAYDGEGYTITIWLWKNSMLYQGLFQIHSNGQIKPNMEVINSNIGVTITIE